MVSKPRLPDDCELPDAVGDWMHAPESNKNGHAWYGPDEECAVAVYNSVGTAYAQVSDERVDGFGRGKRLWERNLDDVAHEEEPTVVAEGIEHAVAWMHRHAPPWRHHDVVEAAFEPPQGYVLDRYYLEVRDTTIYYRRADTESRVRMAGVDEPEAWSYLRLHVWHGSGNAEIAVAPWLRAHDDEVEPVVDCPDECGLDVALMLAREWVGADLDAGDVPAAGQQSLGRWSA